MFIINYYLKKIRTYKKFELENLNAAAGTSSKLLLVLVMKLL